MLKVGDVECERFWRLRIWEGRAVGIGGMGMGEERRKDKGRLEGGRWRNGLRVERARGFKRVREYHGSRSIGRH